MLYATLLLSTPAEVDLISGNGTARTFRIKAGLQSVKVPLNPGAQRIMVRRGGIILANITGAERVNASDTSTCNKQTFTGVQQLGTQFIGSDGRSDGRSDSNAVLAAADNTSPSSTTPPHGSHYLHRYHKPWPEGTWP
jgi:hypothetical protein